MTTNYSPLYKVCALLLCSLCCGEVRAGIDIVHMYLFELEEISAPDYRGSPLNIHDKNRLMEYRLVDKIACGDGGGRTYDIVMYVLNTGQASLEKIEIPFSSILMVEGKEFPGKHEPLVITDLEAGEARVVKVRWTGDDLPDRTPFEEVYDGLSIVFRAGFPGHDKALKVPLGFCD